MKPKPTILGIIGLVACSLAGFAQENQPAADQTQLSSETINDTARGASDIIPIIVMDEVPLIDAVKNLARQAELNYILDPRVPYGQVGPDGKLVPQPNISIRWENLTAQQALTALLNNYSMVVVEDPKTKISRITVRDPAAPDPLVAQIIQLKYTDPKAMAGIIQPTISSRSKVQADVRTSQLVLLATEKELIAVEELVAKLDLPTRQVLIEAHLLETSKSPSTIKGIDWSGTLEGQQFGFGNNTRTPPAEESNNPLLPSAPTPQLLLDTSKGFNPNTAFLNADGVRAVLSFLNKDADAEVVATPRAVTLDNQTATLSVTRAVPIFKNTAGTQGSPGGSEVTYTNLGVILNVTPRISANDYISLQVTPEVSSIFRTVTKTVASTVNQADEYDIRRIDTQVLIPSGNTLVMGGLMRDSAKKAFTKVPVLGDLPVVGLAFRRESKERDKSNLIIFITPTIVQDDDFQPSQTDFLKSPVPPVSNPKETPWDSGKPLDWSKPIYSKDSVSQERKFSFQE